MSHCNSIYCYNGLCFKPGGDEELIATTCDECKASTQNTDAHIIT